jgi:hypothetical protein
MPKYLKPVFEALHISAKERHQNLCQIIPLFYSTIKDL